MSEEIDFIESVVWVWRTSHGIYCLLDYNIVKDPKYRGLPEVLRQVAIKDGARVRSCVFAKHLDMYWTDEDTKRGYKEITVRMEL